MCVLKNVWYDQDQKVSERFGFFIIMNSGKLRIFIRVRLKNWLIINEMFKEHYTYDEIEADAALSHWTIQ